MLTKKFRIYEEKITVLQEKESTVKNGDLIAIMVWAIPTIKNILY